MIASADFRGASVEDGGSFPGVSGNPAADLVVQVADVEQQEQSEGQKKIFSNQRVLPADFMGERNRRSQLSGREYRKRQPACQ